MRGWQAENVASGDSICFSDFVRHANIENVGRWNSGYEFPVLLAGGSGQNQDGFRDFFKTSGQAWSKAGYPFPSSRRPRKKAHG